jgi:C-terminal processing protease CtpA/Prc
MGFGIYKYIDMLGEHKSGFKHHSFLKLAFALVFILSPIATKAETSKFKLGVSEDMSDFVPSNVGIIGVKYLHKTGETSTVIDVYPHTPAEQAGIQVGDRILEVDGSNIIPLTADQVFAVIAGRPNTDVELKLMRCNQNYGTHLGCRAYIVNLKRMDMNQLASDRVFRVYKYGN